MPVDPAVWQGVSQGIGASTVSSSVAAVGISMGAKVAILSSMIGLVALGFWALTQEENATLSNDNPVPEEQLQLAVSDSLIVQMPLESDLEAFDEEVHHSNNAKNDQSPSSKINITPAAPSSGRQAPDTVVYMRVSPQSEKPTDTVSSYEIARGSSATNLPNHEAVPEITAQFSVIKDAFDPLMVHFISECQDAHAYYWELGNGQTSFEPAIDFEYEDFGEYVVSLVVTDAIGKTETHESVVKLSPPSELFVPNVFSPNGDQWNDLFDIEAESKNVELTSLFVFDSQNKEVFISTEARKKWDGTDMHGNICPQGNYSFWFEAMGTDGRIYKQRGTVVLKR